MGDLTGNSAVRVLRDVMIEDNSPPVLSLKGAIVNYLEAGFPYIDAGATATDNLDGDITQYIWTDGDTVTDQRAYYNHRSCQCMEAAALGENPQHYLKNGEYYITPAVTHKEVNGDSTSHIQYKRVLVHCAFHSRPSDSNNPAYTNAPVDATFTFKVHPAGTADCSSFGMATFDDATDSQKDYMNTVLPGFGMLSGNQGYTACTVSDRSTTECKQYARTPAGGVNTNRHAYFHHENFPSGVYDHLQDAEQGRYVIQFNVEDKSGLHAAPLFRTVIVKDTLPPVVSLQLKQDRHRIETSTPFLNAEDQAYAERRPIQRTGAFANVHGGGVHGHDLFMAEVTTKWLRYCCHRLCYCRCRSPRHVHEEDCHIRSCLNIATHT